MVLSVTPTLGAGIGAIYNTLNPPKHVALGHVCKGDDGHDYVFAQASGVIAAGPTVVILTEPAMTAATGAGAWTYTGTVALAAGDQTYFKKTAI